MNEILLRKQAKARLELLEAGLRTQQSTPQEVAEARAVYEALRSGIVSSKVIAPPSAPTSSVPTRKFAEEAPKQLSEQVSQLVKQLRAEQQLLDERKAELSNSLQDFPKETNLKHITDEILHIREEWIEKGDEIRYVMQHGCLPQDEPMVADTFVKGLPTNKFELDREIKNLKINLKKYQDRKATCKTVVKIKDYDRKIAIGQIKLAMMESLFNSLKK